MVVFPNTMYPEGGGTRGPDPPKKHKLYGFLFALVVFKWIGIQYHSCPYVLSRTINLVFVQFLLFSHTMI